jgi:hypothetical protein
VDRRRFLLTPLVGALAAPLAGRAQESRRLPRVAFVGPASEQDAGAMALFAVFKRTLREAGHEEGRNIEIEGQFLAGRLDRMPDAIANVLTRRPDVIVVIGTLLLGRVKRRRARYRPYSLEWRIPSRRASCPVLRDQEAT